MNNNNLNITTDELNRVKEALSIKVPYVSAYIATLGGENRPTLMLTISFDSKESWLNGILQNSRYILVSIHNDGVTEQFSGGFGLRKNMRKFTAKSIDHAIEKLLKYIEEVK